MKQAVLSTNIIIKTEQRYTASELFGLMKENLGDRFGTFELKKVPLGGEQIITEGVDGYKNYVNPSKNKITICQIQTTAKGIAGALALDAVTDGWSTLLKTQGIKGNQVVMKALAEEIEKFVN